MTVVPSENASGEMMQNKIMSENLITENSNCHEKIS